MSNNDTSVSNRRPHGPQEYRGNGAHDWERVDMQTERLRVPGGWLYKFDDIFSTATMVFVPLPPVVGYHV